MRHNIRNLNCCSWPGLLATAFLPVLANATPHAQESKDVDVKVAKYQALTDTIKQLKGKVIIVDCWSLTCPSCIKEFPHLVEMHRKYGKDGVVAISVDVDDPAEEDAKDKVLTFLTKQKAAFPNFILDEKPEIWQEKFDSATLPIVFVFDRDGKIADKFGGGEDVYVDVEKVVVDLLKKN